MELNTFTEHKLLQCPQESATRPAPYPHKASPHIRRQFLTVWLYIILWSVSSLLTGSSSASQAKILYTFLTPSTHVAWSAYPVFFNFSILNYLTSRNKYKTVYYVAAGEAGLVVTRLRIRWSMIQIPIGPTDLSLLQNTPTGSGTEPTSCWMGSGVLLRW